MKHACFIILIILFLAGQLLAADTSAVQKIHSAKKFDELKKIVENYITETNAALENSKDNETPDAVAQKVLEQAGIFFNLAGEKMLNLGKNNWDKEEGFQTQIQGLKYLNTADKLAYFGKLKKEAGIKKEDEQNPAVMEPLLKKMQDYESPADTQLQELLAAIEKEGKYENVIVNHLFEKYQRDGYAISSDFTEEKYNKFIAETKKLLNRNWQTIQPEDILQTTLDIARSIQYSRSDKGQFKAELIQTLTQFINSEECRLPREKKEVALDALMASERREIGSELNLYGKQLDGKDLDWKSLRGKIVLVEFTATWCIPCREEIPFMKKAYEKYRSKGFEIVSVFVLENGSEPEQRVKKFAEDEKLPWLVVSESLTEKSGGKKQSKYYSINGVPCMLLLGEDGKIIDTEVRREMLERKLEKLFP